nr:S8 family serine peptidase [Paenibacillus sediminis]
MYSNLWGLPKIDAPDAWDITKGSKDVVVAVIDSGVDYTHPDLAGNMWSDPKGNHGYDFVDNDDSPMDLNGHGTHIAGTIAAVGNNSYGVSGVMWNARIMAVRALDQNGQGSLSQIIDAITYATDHGADIINMSFAGDGKSRLLEDAIKEAGEKGVLVVTAAGNEGKDNDSNPLYPASYDLPNIIAVAATDSADRLASFSDYGVRTVDVAAPGVNILSTWVNQGNYQFQGGTSMATPYVAGIAGLIKAKYLEYGIDLGYDTLKSKVLSSVDKIPGLSGKVTTGGRVNAYRALTIGKITSVDVNGPSTVTIPSAGSAAASYEAIVRDEYTTPMAGQKVTWSLKSPYAGVTIDKVTGKLNVTSDAVPGKIRVVASSVSNGAVTGTLKVYLQPTGSPLILLKGNATIRMVQGSQYMDEGATVKNDEYGITLIKGSGNVDYTTPGKYLLTYSLTLKDGSEAGPIRRKVIVAPKAPAITGGKGEITVTGVNKSSILNLYNNNNQLIMTREVGISGNYVFTNVPKGEFYYVTQTINGVEGRPSNRVEVTETEANIALEYGITDIGTHWALVPIVHLVEAGAINGYPDGTFRPNNTITRAEFVSILVRAFNLKKQPGKVFSDTQNHWAKDAIATAYAYGIVNGLTSTKFGVNEPITREQMAVMIVNTGKLTSAQSNITFKDSSSISSWAKDAVNAAAGAGVIGGYPNGTFKPRGNATRAEGAAVIVRAMNVTYN